jgi:non-homologous end joining protein Ku
MRPIWSGTISPGLVSVRVRMFPATASKGALFPLPPQEGPDADRPREGPARRPAARRPDDIARGFEIEKGRYVPLEDDDLDRLDIELQLELIRTKAEGQPLPERPAEEEAEVVDLMPALRESIERTKRKRRSTSKRKAS